MMQYVLINILYAKPQAPDGTINQPGVTMKVSRLYSWFYLPIPIKQTVPTAVVFL